jgi:hypothetical protein
MERHLPSPNRGSASGDGGCRSPTISSSRSIPRDQLGGLLAHGRAAVSQRGVAGESTRGISTTCAGRWPRGRYRARHHARGRGSPGRREEAGMDPRLKLIEHAVRARDRGWCRCRPWECPEPVAFLERRATPVHQGPSTYGRRVPLSPLVAGWWPAGGAGTDSAAPVLRTTAQRPVIGSPGHRAQSPAAASKCLEGKRAALWRRRKYHTRYAPVLWTGEQESEQSVADRWIRGKVSNSGGHLTERTTRESPASRSRWEEGFRAAKSASTELKPYGEWVPRRRKARASHRRRTAAMPARRLEEFTKRRSP